MNYERKKIFCPKCQSDDVRLVAHKYHCRACGYEWQLVEDASAGDRSLTIRNSTAEFLIFQAQSQANGVEVFYRDETLWLTQKAMAMLFDVDRTVITKHLKNIFDSIELQMDSVCAKFAQTASDGKTYSTNFYN